METNTSLQGTITNGRIVQSSDGYDNGPEPIMDRTGENHIRAFNVEQLNYGYIVRVGCHSFAIEKHATVTKMIGEYLANPNETEEKWFANKLGLKRNPES